MKKLLGTRCTKDHPPTPQEKRRKKDTKGTVELAEDTTRCRSVDHTPSRLMTGQPFIFIPGHKE